MNISASISRSHRRIASATKIKRPKVRACSKKSCKILHRAKRTDNFPSIGVAHQTATLIVQVNLVVRTSHGYIVRIVDPDGKAPCLMTDEIRTVILNRDIVNSY